MGIFFADVPVLFVGGLFGVMISSISFGQESKAVMVLYSLPISPREILKAKAFFALSFALVATVATGVYFAAISGAGISHLLENLLIGGAIAVEEVCVGLAFGASFPDFQERPRPRFVDPFWQLVMIILCRVSAPGGDGDPDLRQGRGGDDTRVLVPRELPLSGGPGLRGGHVGALLQVGGQERRQAHGRIQDLSSHEGLIDTETTPPLA